MSSRTTSLGPHADLNHGPRRSARILTGLIFSFLIIITVWMNLAALDISVRASGSVIPSSRIQQVQSLEGGIIRELLVREGEQVTAGQLLAKLDTVDYDAQLREQLQNYWGMLATLARLDAEMHGREPVFPADVSAQAPELVAREQALWRSRQAAREASIATAEDVIEQRSKQLAEARSQLASLKDRKQITLAQLEIETSLYQQDAGSRGEYLSAQAEDARMKGEIDTMHLTISRLEAAVAEARASKRQVAAEFLAEVGQQYSELKTRVDALKETLPSSQDRLLRRNLHAPRSGIINRLLITTIGGVVKPGESIMEIVPVSGSLLISTRVKPSDIGFIKPGQKAKIRVSAYDSSVFGAVEGEVVRVGADTIFDERKQPYFEVQLKARKNYLESAEQRLPITPGMAVDVSIKTGKRTVMEYLLKPIVKNFQTALQER
jgi:adhesin transport system membrane fusion protein